MQQKQWIILTIMLLLHLTGQDVLELESPSAAPATIPDDAISSIAKTVNHFGHKLLVKMMNENKNDNIVISPTGIAGLLAMTMLGSVGRTYDEIAKVLGFSQDIFANRKNHELLGGLLQSLNTNTSSKTLYADAMFVDVQTPLRDLYRNYLHNIYHGEVLNTDFKQSGDAKNVINEWVKNNTEGQIEDFLKNSLPTSTKLVLLSALYFKGQWEKPFTPEYTAQMPFKSTTGEVMADLMLNFGHFPFTISENHDFIMIGIPYNDSETIMYALKPRLPKQMSLLTVMEKMDYENIDNLINRMTERKCVLRFPKMKLKSSVSLENTLKSIGIQDMFSPGEANFALMVNGNAIANKTEEDLIKRISDKGTSQAVKRMLDDLPNPGIHVDSVMHDVRINIDEYGTEAVAATSGILARSAELFYADSPFYMFIRNSKTKLVTFSAVIFDPTV